MTRLYTEKAQSYMAHPLITFFEAVSMEKVLLHPSLPQQRQHHEADNDPVIAPDLKAIFFQKTDEGANGQHANDKGDDAGNAKQCEISAGQGFRMILVYVPETFYRSGHHGRDGQKEREFGSGLAGQLLAHAPDNGNGATTDTRQQDRQYLEKTDAESGSVGDLPLVVDGWISEPAIHEK